MDSLFRVEVAFVRDGKLDRKPWFSYFDRLV